jgi:hypothetical protein
MFWDQEGDGGGLIFDVGNAVVLVTVFIDGNG